LADIDLASSPGINGTGLGLAQDIRAHQKKRSIADYPLIRFANPNPIREYVGDDPASDDLFDLLLSKDTTREDVKSAVKKMIAIRGIYDTLNETPPSSVEAFANLCGLDEEHFEVWADDRLWAKVRLGLGATASVHVAAGAFLRAFLLPEGLLLSEDLLAVRLGVDRAKSAGWSALIEEIKDIRYTGVGSDGFKRWWARGLETFWQSLDQEEYLYQRSASERVEILGGALARTDLLPIEPDDRYWRLCALSQLQGEIRPIDPQHSVLLVQRVTPEPWIEPEQAAFDVAAMYKTDPRVDPKELARVSG
jgi:hypothetical protein